MTKNRAFLNQLYMEMIIAAADSRLSSASSTLSILLRIMLFLATTLFPFVLTFYFGKTPMFFLPPSGISSASASRTTRLAPGGFTIPNNPNHAWELINETYLGPFGWFLSLTAAPKGKSFFSWVGILLLVIGPPHLTFLLLLERLSQCWYVVNGVHSGCSSCHRSHPRKCRYHRLVINFF